MTKHTDLPDQRGAGDRANKINIVFGIHLGGRNIEVNMAVGAGFYFFVGQYNQAVIGYFYCDAIGGFNAGVCHYGGAPAYFLSGSGICSLIHDAYQSWQKKCR